MRRVALLRFAHPGVVASALVLSPACEQKKQERPPETFAPSAVPGLPVLDAGLVVEPVDPPAPAGDLAVELEHFVNVDTCVAERAKLDPLVGDALSAIGYETFLRDACRLLEAAKDRRRDACDRIDSSALRARCDTWVAMISQAPDACPMLFEALVTRGRDPSCVAIAARDPRLCAGEGRTAQRATCEAMVAREPARCDGLMAAQRASCQREVARWRSVLSAPLEGLDKLPAARGKLVVHGASGTPDPPATEVDLGSELARGVVVVTARERMRVELGTVVESEAARIAASPQRKARVGLAVVLGSSDRRDAKADGQKAELQKLELELPGEAPIVSPPSPCDCKLTTARIPATRGGEAALLLQGTVTSGGRSYAITLDVTTFVRDVVPERPGSRVLPPEHPVISGVPSLDGARR